MIKRLISFIFLFISFFSLQAQSESFRGIFDQLPGNNKFFFYPSTLRALSGGNEEFLDFVKDIKNLKLVVIDAEDENFKKLELNKFREEIANEGFAELMTIKEGNSLVTVLEHDETTLALLNSKDNVAIVEMVGKINVAAGMKMLREGELPLKEFESFFKREKKKEPSPQKKPEEKQTNK